MDFTFNLNQDEFYCCICFENKLKTESEMTHCGHRFCSWCFQRTSWECYLKCKEEFGPQKNPYNHHQCFQLCPLCRQVCLMYFLGNGRVIDGTQMQEWEKISVISEAAFVKIDFDVNEHGEREEDVSSCNVCEVCFQSGAGQHLEECKCFFHKTCLKKWQINNNFQLDVCPLCALAKEDHVQMGWDELPYF